MKKVYLLAVEELRSPLVYDRAVELLDTERKERVLRYREEKDRMRSVGAGLLLQLAARETRSRQPLAAGSVFSQYQASVAGAVAHQYRAGVSDVYFPWYQVCVSEIFSKVDRARELHYVNGPDGKPYLTDGAFYFSLSHSGDYVICAVSEAETGADIQEKKEADYRKLVNRFFSEREKEAFASCYSERERRDLFYLLWTRKEAWGKLTGRGLLEGLDRMDVLDNKPPGVAFEDYGGLKGYQACVCFRKEEPVHEGGQVGAI